MLFVGKDLVLQRQERAAGIDQVDAGEPILQRDFLRAQVLLHRHGVVRPAFHRGVVGDDHDLADLDAPDAGDDARRGGVVAVHAECGELRELEEGGAGIEERAHALARQQLAARGVLRLGVGAAALGDARDARAQVLYQLAVVLGVRLERLAAGVELGSRAGVCRMQQLASRELDPLLLRLERGAPRVGDDEGEESIRLGVSAQLLEQQAVAVLRLEAHVALA